MILFFIEAILSFLVAFCVIEIIIYVLLALYKFCEDFWDDILTFIVTRFG